MMKVDDQDNPIEAEAAAAAAAAAVYFINTKQIAASTLTTTLTQALNKQQVETLSSTSTQNRHNNLDTSLSSSSSTSTSVAHKSSTHSSSILNQQQNKVFLNNNNNNNTSAARSTYDLNGYKLTGSSNMLNQSSTVNNVNANQYLNETLRNAKLNKNFQLNNHFSKPKNRLNKFKQFDLGVLKEYPMKMNNPNEINVQNDIAMPLINQAFNFSLPISSNTNIANDSKQTNAAIQPFPYKSELISNKHNLMNNQNYTNGKKNHQSVPLQQQIYAENYFNVNLLNKLLNIQNNNYHYYNYNATMNTPVDLSNNMRSKSSASSISSNASSASSSSSSSSSSSTNANTIFLNNNYLINQSQIYNYLNSSNQHTVDVNHLASATRKIQEELISNILNSQQMNNSTYQSNSLFNAQQQQQQHNMALKKNLDAIYNLSSESLQSYLSQSMPTTQATSNKQLNNENFLTKFLQIKPDSQNIYQNNFLKLYLNQLQANRGQEMPVAKEEEEDAGDDEDEDESQQRRDDINNKDLSFVPYKKRKFNVQNANGANRNIDDKEEDDMASGSPSNYSLNESLSVASTPNDNTSSEKKLKPTKQVKEKGARKETTSDQPKKIKRCPHVWQFCNDLLENEKYNPSIIRWLNKEKGIFKIVKPDQVAELWGAQKNRKTDKKMNYEKMARGMRYSRREGFFKKLDKEKNKPNEYGKQLVFQFSEKVVKNGDWKWSFSI